MTQALYDWASDHRVVELGGLIKTAREHRLFDLIFDCFQQIAGELDRSGTVEGLLSVPLLITASPEPDAMLLGHPSGNAITITIGLAEAIETCVHRALMNPVFLSDYLPETMVEGLSEERREFGTHLVLNMLDFVIHHEIAHDIRDHLGVLQEERGVLELGEVLSLNAMEEGDDLYRNVEFDADIEALDLQMSEMVKFAEIAAWPAVEIEDAFFLQMLAMLLVCQILDQAHEPVTAYRERTHPAPVHRAVIYSDTMVTSFADHHPAGRSWFENIHDQAWYEASIVAETHGFPEGRWRGQKMDDARFDLLDPIRPELIEFRQKIGQRQ